MGKNVVIASTSDYGYKRIAKSAQNQGYHPRKASDGLEAANLAREYLPNAVFLDIDLSPENGVRGAKKITDTYGVNSLVVITYQPGQKQLARIALGTDGADEAISHPLKHRDIIELLKQSPDDTGFNGTQRATFIDRQREQEHQTPHGTVRVIENADRHGIVVLEDNIPDWVKNSGVEVVVGKSGTLIDAFTIATWDFKPSHTYGLPGQYFLFSTYQ